MTATYEITEIAISQIIPFHGVTDPAKRDAIAESMEENGWVGRPLLVIETQGVYKGATGSHRFAAAEVAGIEEIPCVVIDTDKMAEYGYSSEDLYDDDVIISIMREIGDEDAANLMAEEIR